MNTLMGGEGQSVFKKRVCPKYVVEIDFRSFISRSHMTAKSQGLRTRSCRRRGSSPLRAEAETARHLGGP